VKVRYYGFCGASVRHKLAPLQTMLGKSVSDPIEPASASSQAEPDAPSKILCPACGLPMIFQRNLSPQQCRSP
jgi:hypothetical protein